MPVYKIRNGQGLFSTGGNLPGFHRDGKVWTTLGALRCHLTQYRDPGVWGQRERDIPADWEVVEYGEPRVVGLARDLHRKEK